MCHNKNKKGPKGQLDKKKFIDAYKAFYPQGKADKFCHHVFKVFDADGSGTIDFTEFLIAISVTAQGNAKKKLGMAFKMYDMDRNGKGIFSHFSVFLSLSLGLGLSSIILVIK